MDWLVETTVGRVRFSERFMIAGCLAFRLYRKSALHLWSMVLESELLIAT